MSLSVQMLTLSFSFLYGVFFEVTFACSVKIIYHTSRIIQYVGTFLFVIFHVLFYFLILQKINYGIVHIYSVLCLVLGYIVTYNVQKHLLSRFTFFHKK